MKTYIDKLKKMFKRESKPKLPPEYDRLLRDIKAGVPFDSFKLPSSIGGKPILDMKSTACPACSGKIDCGIGQNFDRDDASPHEGDVGVCHHCGAILEYEKGKLRLVSEDTWTSMNSHTKQQALSLSKMSIHSGGRKGRQPNLGDEIKEVFGDE